MNTKAIYIKIFFLVLWSYWGVNAQSQTFEFENIKSSDQYIWGYGQSEDYDVANKRALQDLLSKISVHVENKFDYYYQQENGNFKEYSQAVMNTYSNATLTGIRQLEYEKRGTFHILRYIPKEDLDKIFSSRTDKMKDYYSLGTKAQNEYRIGDALKYYYWAYALWLSHPYRSDIKDSVNGREIMLGLLLEDKINTLFSSLKFQIVDKVVSKKNNKTKLIIACTYQGHKVENLDYRYNLGGNISTLQEVNNGLTEITLYGDDQDKLDHLRIGIEYKYLNKSYHDKDLSAVLNTVQIPFFKKSKKRVKQKKRIKTMNEDKPEKLISPTYESMETVSIPKSHYKKVINNLLADIVKKDFKHGEQYFTAQGKKMFDQLIKNGNVSVFPLFDTLKIIPLSDVTMVRSIPMSFYFPHSNHQYVEQVVFTFNKEGKISDVSFAISNTTIQDILRHSNAFGSLQDKYTLIRFMEAYKTAYSLKQIDYIRSVFSDDALIIVGTVLKKQNRSLEPMMNRIGQEAVKYQKMTKKEYIERLTSVFKSNEYINIDFDEAKVKKVNGKSKIYGIQIAQHYYSSRYSDFGYLFLMIDLNDSLHPTIYVRTWQPQKNKDGSIYGLEDFFIN